MYEYNSMNQMHMNTNNVWDFDSSDLLEVVEMLSKDNHATTNDGVEIEEFRVVTKRPSCDLYDENTSSCNNPEDDIAKRLRITSEWDSLLDLPQRHSSLEIDTSRSRSSSNVSTSSHASTPRKGAWDTVEDRKLMALVAEQSQIYRTSSSLNWAQIARNMGGRTAKQCRERWTLSLDPSISRKPWSKEEDEKLVQLQRAIGNKWATIKTMMPGRTENQVKSRFNSLKRSSQHKATSCV